MFRLLASLFSRHKPPTATSPWVPSGTVVVEGWHCPFGHEFVELHGGAISYEDSLLLGKRHHRAEPTPKGVVFEYGSFKHLWMCPRCGRKIVQTRVELI